MSQSMFNYRFLSVKSHIYIALAPVRGVKIRAGIGVNLHHDEIQKLQQNHNYICGHYDSAERRMRWVLALTFVFMIVEILAGYQFQSMALLADGWHMGSHSVAFGISLFGYAFAKKFADDRRFSFGTWKVGVLAGFSSAVILALIGFDILIESVMRILHPKIIDYNEAILVAIAGLLVNAVSAIVLHQKNDSHVHHHHEHADLNHRSAYIHVITDAATSVLAILALLLGRAQGWDFLDPVAGILGAVIILVWSAQLILQSGGILMDCNIDPKRLSAIQSAIQNDADNRISDLHVWKIGPHHYAVVLSIITHTPKPPAHYKQLLAGFHELAHISVEIHACGQENCH